MPLSLKELAKEALELPSAERAELAEMLVGSLESLELTDEIQAAWTGEALRRRDELRSGQVRPVPGNEVLAEGRRLVQP